MKFADTSALHFDSALNILCITNFILHANIGYYMYIHVHIPILDAHSYRIWRVQHYSIILKVRRTAPPQLYGTAGTKH